MIETEIVIADEDDAHEERMMQMLLPQTPIPRAYFPPPHTHKKNFLDRTLEGVGRIS